MSGKIVEILCCLFAVGLAWKRIKDRENMQ